MQGADYAHIDAGAMRSQSSYLLLYDAHRAFGSPLEVDVCGMLRASFSDEGKLEELDMMFDGVAAYQQLQRAMGVSGRATMKSISMATTSRPWSIFLGKWYLARILYV